MFNRMGCFICCLCYVGHL